MALLAAAPHTNVSGLPVGSSSKSKPTDFVRGAIVVWAPPSDRHHHTVVLVEEGEVGGASTSMLCCASGGALAPRWKTHTTCGDAFVLIARNDSYKKSHLMSLVHAVCARDVNRYIREPRRQDIHTSLLFLIQYQVFSYSYCRSRSW